MEDWGISTDQVHCVVRDNGSNIVKAMSEAGLPSYGCFAHSLKLAVHDGLLTQRVVWLCVDLSLDISSIHQLQATS